MYYKKDIKKYAAWLTYWFAFKVHMKKNTSVAYLKGLSKWRRVVFSFIWYLLSFQRYSLLCIMHFSWLMTSQIVPIWCQNTKWGISLQLKGQCIWSSAIIMFPSRSTTWCIFWCYYGNTIGSSSLSALFNYYHLWLYKKRYIILSQTYIIF